MKIFRIAAVALALLLSAGCSAPAAQKTPDGAAKQNPGAPMEPFEGWRLMTENEYLALYLDGKTTEIIVEDKRTHRKWYSNPQERNADPIAAPMNKDLLSSQISITYHTADSHVKTMNNYTDSVAAGQFEIFPAAGGVRIVYSLGKKEDILILPSLISEERFSYFYDRIEDEADKKVFRQRYKLLSLETATSEERRAKLLEDYPVLEKHNLYRMDKGVSGYLQDKLEEILKNAGYTLEDFAKDNAENKVEIEIPETEAFTIPLEYILDGKALKVSVPVEEIEYNPVFPLLRIRILEFFGAAGTQEEGYLFVPDGSGALINLNNAKGTDGGFTGKVYGEDYSIKGASSNGTRLSFPVFGLKTGSNAFFAVIGEGDAMSYVGADVSGRINSYNNVFAEFDVLSYDKLDLGQMTGSHPISIYQPRVCEGNYSVRYTFLSGADAGYSGMARAYQGYLLENGMLKKNPVPENWPFYLELVGAADKPAVVLGIRTEITQPLTSYEEALEIVRDVRKRGVGEIVLKYEGMLNGGVRHTPVSAVRAIGKLGGKGALGTLVSELARTGVTLYPDLSIQYIFRTALFDGFSGKRDSLRFINKDVAVLYPRNIATFEEEASKSSRLLLNPARYSYYAQQLAEGLEALGIGGYSSPDMGRDLSSAYDKKTFQDRQQMAAVHEKTLKQLRDAKLGVLVSGANAYALSAASGIVNLPYDSSMKLVADESVPFLQMVLRGYVDYAGEPLNLYFDPQRALLKTIETGGSLHYKWIYRDNKLLKRTDYDTLYSVTYTDWIDKACAQYQSLSELMNSVLGQRITDHSRVADGVYRVTYENGVRVCVNYGDQPAVIGTLRVEAGSYAAERGDGK